VADRGAFIKAGRVTARNTTIRDRHRRAIARDKPPCHICQGEIDFELPYLHPSSFVVDHVVPLALGGEDALSNKKAAHRHPRLQPSEER
jgi:5-methylcytosine-specific restriction endonuclease McrA